MQLKNTYPVEAEFRLNILNVLLQDYEEDVHRIFVIIGFPKYLI